MITINTSTTTEAVSFVKDNIGRLGKIISVEHKRNGQKIDFQTTICGDSGKMNIIGGLTSGYVGGGPGGFIEVLKFLGVDEKTAENIVEENKDNIHSFKYEF